MRIKGFRKIVATVLVMFFVIFLVVQYHYKSFNAILATKSITKVSMRNGNTGGYVSTKNKEKIMELINLVNNRYYRKSFIQLNSMSGFSFYYDFYVGDKQVLRISRDGNNVQLNNVNYHASKPISNSLLTNWFNSLPIIYN